MKSIKVLFIISISLVFSISSYSTESDAVDICQFKQYKSENLKISTGQFRESKNCFISVTELHPENLIYRNHLFTSDGTHMIFNSFGPGPSQKFSGARVLVYLTRTEKLGFQIFAGLAQIKLPNGASVQFNTKTVRIEKSTKFDLEESHIIHPNNEGGIIFKASDFPVLDFGFKLGANPMADMKRKFYFHNGGQSSKKDCQLVNSKILTVKNQNIHWKIKDDKKLLQTLGQLCRSSY